MNLNLHGAVMLLSEMNRLGVDYLKHSNGWIFTRMDCEDVIGGGVMDTVEQLRAFLAEEMKRVSGGDIEASVANATAKLASKILQSVKLELDYNKQCGYSPDIDFLGGDIRDRKRAKRIR